jgi:hypothetical protein
MNQLPIFGLVLTYGSFRMVTGAFVRFVSGQQHKLARNERSEAQIPTGKPVLLPGDDPLILDKLKQTLIELGYPFPKALKGKSKAWIERE